MMSAKDKKKDPLVPRLRFPEFRDAGEWVRKKVHQIAKIYKGKGISKADISSDGKQLCIRYGELYTLYSEVILEVISKTSLPADSLFLSKVNDVIIPSSGETKIDIATSSCVMKDDIALGGDLNIIRACQNGIFISYYFNGNLKEEIAKKAQGDTVVHLYPSQLDQLDIAIPSKKEQQRIADCLSSLDERIAAETNKLDALKDHKKGLLKQLFPAEGETLPQLRFPEFRDAGEWVRKKVHQIAKIYKGKGISKADISSDGKQLCIRYGELYTLYSEVILEVISKTSLPADSLFLSKVNDVIIPSSGETKIDIATSSCVMKDDIALGGDLNIIRACQNGIFISYYFNGNLKEEIAKKAQGDTVVHLYPSQLDQLNIAIPSKKEQQRIADCLSSLDELIAAQTQKINLLKDHKKGLMQQLFPALDEVRA